MHVVTAYRPRGGETGLALVCMIGALIVFAAFTSVAISRNGWVFEYPLDDVYIHLAMAEQIAAGGYGVNAGEYSSAASSPLYPLLLTPLADTHWQRWLPLIWNIVGLSAAAWLFGLALARAGFERLGVLFAAVAPLALSMYMTAFTGMENMLHVAASLAIVLGLWRFVETNRIDALLIAGVVVAPALRLEGLALALAAGGVVTILGRFGAGVGLASLGLLPVVVFSAFLVSLGLDPLPNSVVAKLSDTEGGNVFSRFTGNAGTYGGRFLLALSLVVLLLGFVEFRRNRRRGYFAVAVALAGLAHLFFGSTGWMDRYETYATVSLVAALALLLGTVGSNLRSATVGAALLGGLLTYGPYALSIYAWNPKAVAAQQGQMARFAKEFVLAPVAVNDIGFVAWRNPSFVLDLWGLASSDALALRSSGAAIGWAGPLALERGVKFAMIYDKWLSDAVPGSWQRLGTLHLEVPTAFLGDREVGFYSTDPMQSHQLLEMLRVWEKDLPDLAWFEFSGTGQ